MNEIETEGKIFNVRHKFIIIICLFVTNMAYPVFGEEPLTLERCYRLALEYSAAVAISNEEIAASRARFAEALGAILPRIQFRASEFFQEDPGGSAAGVPNTFIRTSRPEVSINAVQPLFQGLKEFQSLKISRADAARVKALEIDARRHLFNDVATAFFAVAKEEQEVRTLTRMVDVARERGKELSQRVQLGKSRESEKLSQETDAALIEAELERQQGLKAIAYEMLSFLTGLDSQQSITWSERTVRGALPLDGYLTKADDRPDVDAAAQAVKMAEGNLKVRRADFLPHAEAEGNYYLYRVGFQENIRWDAILRLNIPIFDWGTIGNYRETSAKLRQSREKAADTQRLAATDIKKSYETYRSSLRQLEKYEIAMKKARQSYDAVIADYRLGLVTNLDVLSSQRSWFEAERLAGNQRVEVWLDWSALHVAAGIFPPPDEELSPP